MTLDWHPHSRPAPNGSASRASAASSLLLHVVGWGLFVWYSRTNPALAGLGTLAYTFGLRHAFDADHIAAIDNTTRKMLQNGKRPLGVGLLLLARPLDDRLHARSRAGARSKDRQPQIPTFQHWGGYDRRRRLRHLPLAHRRSSTSLVLLDIVRIFHGVKRGSLDESGSRRACSTAAS